MVAVQVLLMNYFLLGLHTDHQLTNDVILPGKNPILTNDVTSTDIAVDVGCPYGCEQCSPINGCLACKPPFFLLLQRDGARQTATCTRACPRGFYKIRRKKKRGFCAKCMLRGCEECTTRHYCSVCKTGKFRHAGRCYKRCPEGTVISARSPGLCLPPPVTLPDVYNEIEASNATTRPPATPPSAATPPAATPSSSLLLLHGASDERHDDGEKPAEETEEEEEEAKEGARQRRKAQRQEAQVQEAPAAREAPERQSQRTETEKRTRTAGDTDFDSETDAADSERDRSHGEPLNEPLNHVASAVVLVCCYSHCRRLFVFVVAIL
ncbi:R-spondin-1-like [Penaeus japonicus]|uniref:R-spondin-1-like n=1 Tax=Penaeus japonicus TaxID=27405 RepID=UPI001C715409|nr:R-spondin-1-like [Penaeus japonicus]